MSLLTICQDVADEAGLPRPSTIIGNTDQLALQMLALIKTALKDLGRYNWNILERVATFNTVNGTASYVTEADYGRMIIDTAYVSTEYYRLRGSTTPQEWQMMRNEMSSQLGKWSLRVFGSPLKVYLSPTPDRVETVVYEYITSYLAATSGGTAKATFTIDTDVPVLDEDIVKKSLKWRIKHAKGMDYSEDYNEYEMTRAKMLAQSNAFGAMPVAVRSGAYDPPIGTVPEDGFGV